VNSTVTTHFTFNIYENTHLDAPSSDGSNDETTLATYAHSEELGITVQYVSSKMILSSILLSTDRFFPSHNWLKSRPSSTSEIKTTTTTTFLSATLRYSVQRRGLI
jgi:hypothetical protein